MNLRTLQQQRAKHVSDMRALLDKAGENDLSSEDQAVFDGHKASIATVDKLIARESEQIELERSAKFPVVEMGRDRKELDKKGGFKSKGDFFSAIVRAGASQGRAVDERLVPQAAAPSTFGNESSGIDGGFLVPPEFSKEIFTLALTDDALLPMCDNTPVQGNSMVFPKDETTPWGTDGVRAYWQQEATAATATKPKFGATMLRLHKLMGLVPLSDELVEDATAGASFVTPLIARSIRWKTNEAILFGTGAGQPQGMFTGNASVQQNKDSGQAASTLSIGNFANMVSRLVTGSGPAIWLITPDAFPSLFSLTLGNVPAYLPFNAPLTAGVMQGGAAGVGPEGTLLGRPVYKSQHAAAFSSAGDVLLIAPQWYRTITKAGEGVETDQSLHLYFDADAVAFRSIFRVDGQPKIYNPISQAKGSNTLSPFVKLQNR